MRKETRQKKTEMIKEPRNQKQKKKQEKNKQKNKDKKKELLTIKRGRHYVNAICNLQTD